MDPEQTEPIVTNGHSPTVEDELHQTNGDKQNIDPV